MIKENIAEIMTGIPDNVILEAAVKTRTANEIIEAINAGIKVIGENYLQDTEKIYDKVNAINKKVEWHFIGHLQTRKIKKIVKLFDMIETLDSLKHAQEIEKRCNELNKNIDVLIEINSGHEEQKAGILPEEAEEFISSLTKFKRIQILGLMTMGPLFGNPENARTYFIETKKIFNKLSLINLPNMKMKYLSMGMTDTYKIAIEEGANIVRIGTKIFGLRK